MTIRFQIHVLVLSLAMLGLGCSSGDAFRDEDRGVADSPGTPIGPSSVQDRSSVAPHQEPPTSVRTGSAVAASTDFIDWRGSRVGLIAHEGSLVDGVHLADLMARSSNVELAALFGPEHGIRGDADAGEVVNDSIDRRTGVTVFSLYGETRAPSTEMLAGLDVLFYDLQDVGARYYTYISTMGLAMRAAAENGVRFVVLDRPNPLGGSVSGGVLEESQLSFVGQYPIPALYGLTAGELAQAIIDERWLDMDELDLEVVEIKGWSRSMRWADTGLAWTATSPAITSSETTLLYPATVLFEATTLSYGRGTDTPFEVIGAPWIDGEALAARLNSLGLPGVRFDPIVFTPMQTPLLATPPPFVDEPIPGVRLVVTDHRSIDPTELGLHLLDAAIDASPENEIISRPDWLDRLTGSTRLNARLAAGLTAVGLLDELRAEDALFEARIARYRRY